MFMSTTLYNFFYDEILNIVIELCLTDNYNILGYTQDMYYELGP